MTKEPWPILRCLKLISLHPSPKFRSIKTEEYVITTRSFRGATQKKKKKKEEDGEMGVSSRGPGMPVCL